MWASPELFKCEKRRNEKAVEECKQFNAECVDEHKLSDILTDQSLRVCKRFVSGPIIVSCPTDIFFCVWKQNPFSWLCLNFLFQQKQPHLCFIFHLDPMHWWLQYWSYRVLKPDNLLITTKDARNSSGVHVKVEDLRKMMTYLTCIYQYSRLIRRLIALALT